METCRGLVLRTNPDANAAAARHLTIDSLAEYIEQFPHGERGPELARIIGKAASVLESRAEPNDAHQFHALGFHTLEDTVS